jgi:hypothetical protein
MSKQNKVGKLYVILFENSLGPVTDSRHNDLANTWEELDKWVSKLFEPSFRSKYKDSAGNSVKISWAFVSWSGFKTNPVKRDFGWYTVYDHIVLTYGKQLKEYGDGVYWMYNHPDKSGVGNVWGLDWLHNSHYLEILNRYIIERDYFPSVVQVPTEKNDASNWLENWIPFDFSNRNVAELNLEGDQEGGQKIGDVLDWRGAPTNWREYHPSSTDYRKSGNMKRTIFRIIDVKSRFYQLTEAEVEKAFLQCMEGNDTAIAVLEHDFRDRADAIMNIYIETINKLSKKYPDVKWFYSNALEASQGVSGYTDKSPPVFSLEILHDDVRNKDVIRIKSSKQLFGSMPYVVTKVEQNEEFDHHPIDNVGFCVWEIDRKKIPNECIFGVASSDTFGNVGLQKFHLNGNQIIKK